MRRSAVYASVAGVLSCSVAFGGYIALSGNDEPDVSADPGLAGMPGVAGSPGGGTPVQPSVDDPRAAPPDEGGMDRVRERWERREARAGMPLPTSPPTPRPTPSARTAVAAPAEPPVAEPSSAEPSSPERAGAEHQAGAESQVAREPSAEASPDGDAESPAAREPESGEPESGEAETGEEPQSVAMRTVSYWGARFQVPASWPVYRLEEEPETCVRFDEHAVYLGVPTEAQENCPVATMGRTEALQVRPYDGDLYHAAPADRRVLAGRDARLPGHAGQDEVAHEVHAGGAGVMFFATYDRNSALIERILRSVRTVPRPADPKPSPTAPHRTTPTITPTVTPTVTPSPSPTLSATPTLSPTPSPTPTPTPTGGPGAEPTKPDPEKKPKKPKKQKPKKKAKKKRAAVKLNGTGFDTCAAPSVRAMRAWRGAFDAANIYIGGAARACGYGNLSRKWVRQVKKMGWHLIPTYVGYQAPCAPFRTRMSTSRSARQGRASADDAIRRAKHFGLPKGVPIYYDMEAYDSGNDTCRRAVLLFLDAWSERLKDRGYTSGVYSSAAAAARDLGRSVGVRLPDSIWFAQWDGRKSVWDTPYLSKKWWAKRQRIKQYRGPHREKHGGYTLTIDSNRVYGHVW